MRLFVSFLVAIAGTLASAAAVFADGGGGGPFPRGRQIAKNWTAGPEGHTLHRPAHGPPPAPR
jgi:hypothetical protein